jgi:flagellar hook-associated protein 3 FlgL
MKVSDRLATQLLAARVRQGRASVDRAQAEVASGRRVAAPSDDPTAYTRALSADAISARAREHRLGIEQGASMLDAALSALDGAHDLVARARELVQTAASPAATTQGREAVAREIEGIRESLRRLRQTEALGEGVFTATGRDRRIEVSPGVTGTASVDGDAAFAGGVDLDALMGELATAARAGDTTTLRARIDTTTGGLRQLETAIATAGASRAQMDVAGRAAEAAESAAELAKHAAIAADPVRAMAELLAQETALRTSLEVGARLLKPVLVDLV